MKQIQSLLIPPGRGVMETILELYSSTTIFKFYLCSLIAVGSTTIVIVSMLFTPAFKAVPTTFSKIYYQVLQYQED